MDRATKLVVVVWACAAVGVQLWLLRSAWPLAAPLTGVAFAAMAGASAWDRRAVSAVLVFAYIFPGAIALLHGQYHLHFGVVWWGALLGAIVPDALKTRWHIPAPWRGPLVCWALTIVAGASIVIAREADFYPGLVLYEHAAGPLFAAQWVLYVALGLIVGILWFDWLFGADGLDFRTAVLLPLAASACAMSGVALYQLFVDVWFLNQTIFGTMARASGTLFDANICGVIAALWIGGSFLWPERLGWWRLPLVVAGVCLAWLTVWATGSRSAFGAAALVSAFCVPAALRIVRGDPRHRARAMSGLVLVVAVLGLAVLLASMRPTVSGPLRRFWVTLPTPSMNSIAGFVVENAWLRNGYGPASTAMIRKFPWFGVGVGSFQSLLPEFATLEPDNAQNWYRHQLAELGVVGSLGWATWLALFGVFLLKRRPDASGEARIVRGMLIAFALTSFVGMPGQNPVVSVTIWTIAFSFVALAGETIHLAGQPVQEAGEPAHFAGKPGRPMVSRWWLVLAVVVVFCAGTLQAARTTLRPVFRAQRAGSPYEYGFYRLEPDGEGGAQRWARQRAVAIVNARTPWLELTVSANHLDIAEHPVEAEVWVDAERVIATRLDSVRPITRTVAVRSPIHLAVVETRVSRVLRPRDFGVPDGRELGLLVRWRGVDLASEAGR